MKSCPIYSSAPFIRRCETLSNYLVLWVYLYITLEHLMHACSEALATYGPENTRCYEHMQV